MKHPHVRGEDIRDTIKNGRVVETPPRAWGRRRTLRTGLASQGTTPTCVGKTRHGLVGSGASRKHPHVSGEDYKRPEKPKARTGNTPTCVGKTRLRKL